MILDEGKFVESIRVLTSPATVVDLPVPVEPTTLQCLETNLFISTKAGIFPVPEIVPTAQTQFHSRGHIYSQDHLP